MEILNIIILLGAIQGLILALVLFISKAHPGTKFLGGFIFVLAYNGLETYSWSSGLDLLFFSIFPFVVIFAAGPCLYFYLRALLEPNASKSSRSILRHFIPVIALATFRIGMFCFHWYALSSDTTLTTTLYDVEMWFTVFSEPLSFISYAGYVWMSWMHFNKRQTGSASESVEQRLATNWAKNFLFTMTGVVVAWLLTILIPRLLVAEDPYDFHYYPIELTLVGLIYWITFAGYHRNKIIHIKPLKQVGPSLDPELAERCRTLLQESMAPQKMYLDPELTVGKVADHIKLPQKVVSAFINQHLNQSFNDYINHYRVEEVKARLLRNSDQHLTISGIAFDCGFNSQATFQRAFKNFAKQSPKEFLAQHAKKADLLAK